MDRVAFTSLDGPMSRVSPKPAPKREAMGLYAFRLPDALIADVDRFAKRLEAERPGIGVTRAETVRVPLVDALSRAKAHGR